MTAQLRDAVAELADRVRSAIDGRSDPVEKRLVPEGDDRLGALIPRFDLEPLDLDLLVVAAAPDLDAAFEDLYGSLRNDRRATVGLALQLCGVTPWDPAGRARLTPASPLVRYGLVAVEDPDRPFLSRRLRVPDRVVAHLLGDDTPDASLLGLVVELVPAVLDGADRLGAAMRAGVWFSWVRERAGTASGSLAASAFADAGGAAIGIDLRRLPEGRGLDDVVVAATREAALRGAGLVIGPVIGRRDRAGLVSMDDPACPVIAVSPDAWDPSWSSATPIVIEAEPASPEARRGVWRAALGDTAADDLASYRLAPEQIAAAVAGARVHAVSHGGPVGIDDVRAGVRAQNAGRLDSLGRRVEPRSTFDQLVLPGDLLRELRSIGDRVRADDLVRGTWGMGGGGSSRDRGVTCLFAGPSGTGKTLAAECVAADLGVDLYTIDLSQIVDKYIGETEKNLERVFAEAEGVNGVLFFDEADALFGKRSDVKSSHDRNANIEVAYLLQRMERFSGVAVLATNLRGNLDEAFTRRIDVICRFPEPQVDDRLRLWEAHLPSTLPLADDVDLPMLARSLDATGGEIRNVALSAAYAAANEDRPVSMADLVQAAAREYRKMGRLLRASELGIGDDEGSSHDEST